jgi:hypothetical protein
MERAIEGRYGHSNEYMFAECAARGGRAIGEYG